MSIKIAIYVLFSLYIEFYVFNSAVIVLINLAFISKLIQVIICKFMNYSVLSSFSNSKIVLIKLFYNNKFQNSSGGLNSLL